MADQLGQHGIKKGRHFDAALNPVIDAPPLAVGGGEDHLAQESGAGLELAGRILGIEAHLNGVAAGLQRGGQGRQIGQGTGAQLYHPAHQIHAVDLLGDAVLHLQPGIDLQKVEALALGIVDILHRPGAAITQALAQADGGLVQFVSGSFAQMGGRALLDHLLVAALGRAVALADGDHLSLAVTEDLHLDMAGIADKFFQEDAAVAEVVFA